MQVRYTGNENEWIEGQSTRFNTSALSEVIVHFDDGSADTMPISELEVRVRNDWTPMKKAFQDGIIVSDNLNTYFYQRV